MGKFDTKTGGLAKEQDVQGAFFQRFSTINPHGGVFCKDLSRKQLSKHLREKAMFQLDGRLSIREGRSLCGVPWRNAMDKKERVILIRPSQPSMRLTT